MSIDLGASFRIRASVEGQQSLDRFNQSLKDAGRTGEVSAGQIRNAMRTLPAQFTDIATQLAGGQNPFLILLQQGGQIRDSFGGVGNAIRGIASAISPVSLAIGGLAAAAGTLVFAFAQGEAQTAAFSRALATTGNFAGTTASRFEDAAARIQAGSDLSVGSTRELLQAIIQTGQFGPRSYEAVADAAAQVSRVTGQGATEVLKQFTSLSQGAAKWAAEANKTYNFLDVAQYRYIRGLEEAGDKEGAQRVAVELLSKSLKEREVQLGSLQRAWKNVGDFASWAWDKMLGIGRENTTAQRLEEAQARLQRLQQNQANARSDNRARYQPAIDAAQAQVDALREVIRLEGRAADSQAQRARENQAAIAAEQKAEEDRKKNTTERLSEFEQLRRGLEGQMFQVQELNREETLLAEIQAGRYTTLKPAEQERLLALAREIDSAERLKKAAEEKARADKLADDRAERQREVADRQRQAEIDRFRDLANPAQKYIEQLDRINQLQREGALTATEAASARDAVAKSLMSIGEASDRGKDSLKELKDAVEGWGRAATDTFVDFAFGAKASFGDLVTSILKDLARMTLQQNLFGPLFKAVQGGSGGGLGGILSAIGNLFKFANGGVMTGSGAVPLRKYSRGGVASSPQLALFGEGRQPEAYVPLPDGRSIPVTVRGGGSGGGAGTVNIGITVNAQTGQTSTQGDGAASLRDLGQRVAAAARQVIVEEQRPGGLLYGA